MRDVSVTLPALLGEVGLRLAAKLQGTLSTSVIAVSGMSGFERTNIDTGIDNTRKTLAAALVVEQRRVKGIRIKVGPSIVTLLSTTNSPLVSVMVPRAVILIV